VYWSAGGFTALLFPPAVALTSTVAAFVAVGVIIVQEVVEAQLTEAACPAPNVNVVAPPSAKPLPVTVTDWPPLWSRPPD